MSIKSILEEMNTVKKKKDSLHDQLVEAYRNSYFQCKNKECGKRSKLKSVLFIQTHWYEQPYS